MVEVAAKGCEDGERLVFDRVVGRVCGMVKILV